MGEIRKDRQKLPINTELSDILEVELSKLSKIVEYEQKENKELLKEERLAREKAIKEEEIIREDMRDGVYDYKTMTAPGLSANPHLHRFSRPRARIVTVNGRKDLVWLVYAMTKGKSYWKGYKEIRDYYYPNVKDKEVPFSAQDIRGNLAPELDKYWKVEIVPVADLLKAGFTFPCFCCGNSLDYEDLQDGRCIVVEGEGNVAPFAFGKVICSKCEQSYL